MSYSNLSGITTISGSTSNEDDDEDKEKHSGPRISVRKTQMGFSSPVTSPLSLSHSRLSLLSISTASSTSSLPGLASDNSKKTNKFKRKPWYRKKSAIGLFLFVGFFICMNWWLLSRIEEPGRTPRPFMLKFLKPNSSTASIPEKLQKNGRGQKPQKPAYARLLAKAAHALAEGENKPEPKDLWVEPYVQASSGTPCAHTRNWKPSEGNSGYIMVTANGGINQQRVAVCNAVAVARLLNATLVLPKFMYSSVWRDPSQFSDIYQEDYFINYLKPDVRIVKELPEELQLLDLEAIGSVVTDADVVKEAKPSFYKKYILPILHLNKVVHFIGFGNRLASDPIPQEIQRLRCRCNFHALRFVSKIQEAGALLVQRMHQNDTGSGRFDHYLVGQFAHTEGKGQKAREVKGSRYLALHLRFEIDMVAHSLCEFGGGEEERLELEAYRKVYFPALAVQNKSKEKRPSPTQLRSEGLCPLMPEETVLMLAALGFSRRTHIYLAGADIYGGKSRLSILTTLFPNLVTKESLLTPSEIEPFANFSSQLAALDFIACTASDVFGMTDPGSQFSSLIAGYRIYFGGGKLPTIRPNKRRLADILGRNNTIEWNVFETRVRKAVRQNQRIFARPPGRSVYRYPRCEECMCFTKQILQ